VAAPRRRRRTGVTQGERKSSQLAEERRSLIVISKGYLASLRRGDAASAILPPRKAIPSALRRTPQPYTSIRPVAVLFEKMILAKLKFLSYAADRLSLRESASAPKNFIRASSNAGKRASAASPRGLNNWLKEEVTCIAEPLRRPVPCLIYYITQAKNCAAHVPHLPPTRSSACTHRASLPRKRASAK